MRTANPSTACRCAATGPARCIDSTNPQAREWFWDRIRDNIASQGFDWFWLDETEPDLVPDGYFYSIGSGDRYPQRLSAAAHAGRCRGVAARPSESIAI